MENLALCSKVLYDRDLLKKTEKLKKLEPPRIIFNKYSDYEHSKAAFYISIESAVYEYNNEQTISESYIQNICDTVEKGLIDLTNNPEWSKSIAYENVYVLIRGLIYSFKNIWEIIYEFVNAEHISEMIYDNIYCYFENNLFSKIIFIKCVNCNKVEDWVQKDTDMCWNCIN